MHFGCNNERRHAAGGSWRGGGRHWGPIEVEWSVGPRGGGGGGGRRRMFAGDELRLILLALIADAPRHGYDLIREIEGRTGGAYAPSPGVVYPTLTLLAEMGHIEEQASEGAKKLYAITAAGTAELEAQAEAIARLMGRLAEIGVAQGEADRRPVRRAMGNLKMAVMGRVTGADDATVNAVIDILDDAARRIERL